MSPESMSLHLLEEIVLPLAEGDPAFCCSKGCLTIISSSHYVFSVSQKGFFSSGNEDKTVREAWQFPQPVLDYLSAGRAIVHTCIQGLPGGRYAEEVSTLSVSADRLPVLGTSRILWPKEVLEKEHTATVAGSPRGSPAPPAPSQRRLWRNQLHAEMGVQNSALLPSVPVLKHIRKFIYFFFTSYRNGMGHIKIWGLLQSSIQGVKSKQKGCNVFGVIHHHRTHGAVHPSAWLFPVMRKKPLPFFLTQLSEM